ncbi:formylglycine-generating enzyme family protein [Crocinitomicaceae bacterium]|nr:formylglycine-generating enzyme family protein [Crocinitomicaceae bacterium]
MKHFITTLIFSIVLTPCIMGQNSNGSNSKISGTPNMKSHYCDGITIVPGGSFTKNQMVSYDKYLDEDTTLLYPGEPKRDSVASFYISDHEVTNAEYREFVHWVRDSIARAKLFKRCPLDEKHLWGTYTNMVTRNADSTDQYFVLNWDTELDFSDPLISFLIDDMYFNENERFYLRRAFDVRLYSHTYDDIIYGDTIPTRIHIYPDTLCWVREFDYSYNDPMTKNYFWHHAYDNYPVVGITWTQAKAYCDWRTKRYMDELKKKGPKTKSKYIGVKFTLPNDNQWSYASKTHIIDFNRNFGLSEKGYIGNFGNIILNSGIQVKNHRGDGHFRTASVKSYPKNEFGLYDMLGNVSEWIQENPTAKPDNFFENLIKKYKYDIFNQSVFLPFGHDSHALLNDTSSRDVELYITNPYTKKTHLVTLGSTEHKRILKQRLKFYNISASASVDDILKSYLAFNSVDESFRDSILKLQKTETPELAEKDTVSIGGVIDGVYIMEEPQRYYENPLELYNNYTGLFETEEKKWAEEKLVRLIRELKHNWEVVERAERKEIPLLGKAIDACRLVKGGSWANQPHYLNTASNEVYHEFEASCKIGFRVMMEAEIVEENGVCINCTAKDRKKMKKYRKNQQEREKSGWYD